jgi:hypothetical protein
MGIPPTGRCETPVKRGPTLPKSAGAYQRIHVATFSESNAQAASARDYDCHTALIPRWHDFFRNSEVTESVNSQVHVVVFISAQSWPFTNLSGQNRTYGKQGALTLGKVTQIVVARCLLRFRNQVVTVRKGYS